VEIPDELLRLEPLLDRVERLERSESDTKLAERMSALERALAEQSASMESMRRCAAETNAGVQRLTASIDRVGDLLPPPVSQPTPVLLPFERQMSEAAHRQITEEPRVRVIKEIEPKR